MEPISNNLFHIKWTEICFRAIQFHFRLSELPYAEEPWYNFLLASIDVTLYT